MLLMTVAFELSTSPLLPSPQLLAALTRGTVLDGPDFCSAVSGFPCSGGEGTSFWIPLSCKTLVQTLTP